MASLILTKADITKVGDDAIVNAANKSLLGGGGVDGAIHRAAGPEMLAECIKLNGCETGQAKITNGYNLPAKYVIHTVGPIYIDGKHGEPELLASCYRESLALAVENGIRTIAFPCISTGVYGYPFRDACAVALRAITEFLNKNEGIECVTLVCYSNSDLNEYRQVFSDIWEQLDKGFLNRRNGRFDSRGGAREYVGEDIFQAVKKAVDKGDFCRLCGPDDEYDIESRSIAVRLKENNYDSADEIAAEILDVFEFYFGKGDFSDAAKAKMKVAAEEIWQFLAGKLKPDVISVKEISANE